MSEVELIARFIQLLSNHGREIVRALIFGADGFAVNTDRHGSLQTSLQTIDGPNVDGYGRIRVSNPDTVMDSVLRYDDEPLHWETQVFSGGASIHNSNQSAVLMAVTTTNGSRVLRQSREYIRTQPGKSQQIIFSFVFGRGQDKLIQRAGYFDDNDGIFIELRGESVRFVQRTSVSGVAVDNVVEQAQWILDNFDGKGLSEVDLDMTRGQIALIDLQWLSLGRVRTGFEIDGRVSYCHQFNFANQSIVPEMRTADLPIRYEILADGPLESPAAMAVISSAVGSEGGVEDERAFPFTSGTGTLGITVSTRRPVFSIRPRATFITPAPEAAVLVNRVPIRPESVEILADNIVFWEVVYDGVLTGAAFADVDSTHSVVQADIAATAITGGITIEQGYVAAGPPVKASLAMSGIRSRLPLTVDIDGLNPINLSLVATKLVDGNAAVRGALAWRELR